MTSPREHLLYILEKDSLVKQYALFNPQVLVSCITNRNAVQKTKKLKIFDESCKNLHHLCNQDEHQEILVF